jgi:mannose-6-phosphate isomerase-like protein (cupin superfamily)
VDSSSDKPSAFQLTDLPGRDASRRFEGAQRGSGVPISFFEERTEPGRGPGPHRHPYGEVFVLHEGEVEFVVEGEKIPASAGAVVVVPPETTHGFTNVGDDPIRMTCIHAAAEMEQQNL